MYLLTKYRTQLFCALILLAVIIAVALKNNHEQAGTDSLPIEASAIKTSIGWGYQITVDGKVFIRQPNIPAVSGNVGFASKQDALLVAKYSMEKLKKGKLPEITVEELKQWGIVN